MFKKVRKRLLYLGILIVLVFVGLIMYSQKIKLTNVIENIKAIIGIENTPDTLNEITTIDVTGIITGKETEHEHIYKTIYDENKHWEECKSCGEKRNESTHSFTTTWATGKDSCHKDNSYTKTCTCGYSEIGHKPCVWDGKSYALDSIHIRHYRKCKICRDYIQHSYYLNTYGNGKVYYLENFGKENCSLSNGNRIMCTTSGKCVKCGVTYSGNKHAIMGNNGIFQCLICNQEYGIYNNEIKGDLNAPTTYNIITNIQFTNGLVFNEKGEMRNIGDPWQKNTQVLTSGSIGESNIILTTTVKFKPTWKKEYNSAYITCKGKLSGQIYTLIVSFIPSEHLYPDLIKPTISNISTGDSSTWSKSRTITISGTENWTDTVKAEIIDDKGEKIYTGSGNVTNKNYSISCTPELEAGLEGRTFKAIVTDACENSIEQEFTISKIDGIVPEVTSSNEIKGDWAKEKNFTFTATDEGIGNVQIAFNDVSDYKLASQNGNEYSRNYKFIGDVYKPSKAMVFYKDELENTTSQEITIDKIDNTAPTIINAQVHNNILNITANDRHETQGEGSGVVKYRYVTSTEKIENLNITIENSTEVNSNETIKIPNIDKIKYIYIEAEDQVGNISEVYEVKIPELVLTSRVNLENSKGETELDWSSYDITDKYFVIYRKREGETEWKEIVSLKDKLSANTYIDELGNDTKQPTTPEIKITGDIANNIKITATSKDEGTKYQYYIESYDTTDLSLLNISNVEKTLY